ncbi:hypothetical protein AB0451_39380 [Streptomyces sp. NPDC052000]|uniref:hypothetical protein n=1 Tax=Streptomyces sp. NPDC052000 TaxID=3155676 RepID=UPI00344EF27A
MSEHQLVAIDGRDALVYVLVRPGNDDAHVSVEAAARGISKTSAALILRQIADNWDAEEGDAPAH